MNLQFQKVTDGLTACSQLGFAETVCTKCPYYKNHFADMVDEDTFVADFTEDSCSYRLIKDALNLLKEYDSALRMMVYQYCVDGFESAIDIPERFNHSFMSAGENAFKVLGIENGQEVPEDFLWKER